MIISKPVLTVVIALGIIISIFAIKAFSRNDLNSKKVVVAGRTFGNSEAAVKIVEYTDFQCPACAKTAAIVHDEFKRNGSKIYFEFKYFPLAISIPAFLAADGPESF